MGGTSIYLELLSHQNTIFIYRGTGVDRGTGVLSSAHKYTLPPPERRKPKAGY